MERDVGHKVPRHLWWFEDEVKVVIRDALLLGAVCGFGIGAILTWLVTHG